MYIYIEFVQAQIAQSVRGLVGSPTHVSRIIVDLVWETILADDDVFESIYAEGSKPKHVQIQI